MNNATIFHTSSQIPSQIYTTGAYLSPVKVVINGLEQWLWKVDDFDGDSFDFGEVCNPIETSTTLAGLMSYWLD